MNFIRFFSAFSKLNIFLQSFLAGLLIALAFAPFDLFFPAIISISWFYLLLHDRILAKSNIKKIFLLGLSYGAGYFLAANYWISISLLVDIKKFWFLLPFSITLFPLCLGSFFGLVAVVVKIVFDKFKPHQQYQKVLIFSLIWLFFELLRGYVFTGFPWNLIGYAMMFSNYAMQSASIFGVYGLSLLTVIFCLIPILYFSNKSDRYVAHFLLAIFVANIAFGIIRLESSQNQLMSKKARIVQANIEQNLKWDRNLKFNNFMRHIEISQKESLDNTDLLIWPETALPFPVGFNPQMDREVRSLMNDNHFALASGGLRLVYDYFTQKIDDVYNSIFIFTKDESYSYDKHHLVPFGEYVPLQKYLPFVQKITNGSDGFASGVGARTVNIDNPELKISPLVCYEVIFPYNIVEEGTRPDLLLNLTNDAWFQTSSGPFQHLNMSRMRSVEYGIAMARAANTGVSAYIDPYGRIQQKIALNKEGFIDFQLIKPLKATFLSQFKYFMLLLLIISIVAMERTYTTIKNTKNNEIKKRLN